MDYFSLIKNNLKHNSVLKLNNILDSLYSSCVLLFVRLLLLANFRSAIIFNLKAIILHRKYYKASVMY